MKVTNRKSLSYFALTNIIFKQCLFSCMYRSESFCAFSAWHLFWSWGKSDPSTRTTCSTCGTALLSY